MSRTPQPPPFRRPFTPLSHPDPQFAAFMCQVSLPLGRLHACLDSLQQALGPQPEPLADACMQRLLKVCLQLQGVLDQAEADLNAGLQPLSHLLGMLGDDDARLPSRADMYRMLSLGHQQLRRASTTLYLR